jgi:hypothetical protein
MLDRLMRSHGGGPKVKRVMELNPTHELISRMRERLAANTDEAFLKSAADFLFGMALLSEGSELADPVRFNQAAAEVFGERFRAFQHPMRPGRCAARFSVRAAGVPEEQAKDPREAGLAHISGAYINCKRASRMCAPPSWSGCDRRTCAL